MILHSEGLHYPTLHDAYCSEATDLDWYTSEVMPEVYAGDDADQNAPRRDADDQARQDWSEATFDPDA